MLGMIIISSTAHLSNGSRISLLKYEAAPGIIAFRKQPPLKGS